MVQLAQPADPFGEVNVHAKPDGSLEVVATILKEPDIEGALTGLALDASASMRKLYGVSGLVGSVFANKSSDAGNVVQLVARDLAAYLAGFSSTGKVDLIYWALNPPGDAIEEIGRVTRDEAQELRLTGPKRGNWGRGTKLLPPVRHFVERAFAGAPWAVAVIVTDGVLEDLEEVKRYCTAFAREIAAGRKSFVKLVLIGVGDQCKEEQMTELDDMFEGSGLKDPQGYSIDLWDHKMAADMRNLVEIFAEVVSETQIVAARGRVTDDRGRVARDYSDGVPALLRFRLPAGTRSFTLDINGQQVVQDIAEALRR